jgi:hypothetical protein
VIAGHVKEDLGNGVYGFACTPYEEYHGGNDPLALGESPPEEDVAAYKNGQYQLVDRDGQIKRKQFKIVYHADGSKHCHE